MYLLLTIFLLGICLSEAFFPGIKSILVKLPLLFTSGSIVFTFLVFLIACLLPEDISGTLETSYYASLGLSWLLMLPLLYRKRSEMRRFKLKNVVEDGYAEILVAVICLTISYLFFRNHLVQVGDTLYRTIIFWDFPVHFSRINSFIMGNNFPPKDPLFGGAPLTYHFMYHLLEALFITAGFKVSQAVLLLSSLSFAFLLMVIAKFALNLGFKIYGVLLTLFFFLTSSNLRILYDLYMYRETGIGHFFSTRYTEPYKNSQFLRSWYEFYSQHFSLFYFLEERRLNFACLFMMLILYILAFKGELKRRTQICLGLFVGMFFFWHLQAALLLALIFLLSLVFIAKERKALLPVFAISFILILLQTIFVRYLQTDSTYFNQTLENVLGFDFSFPSPDREGSLYRTVIFIFLAYGFKILLLPSGIRSLSLNFPAAFVLLLFSLSGIVIAFSLKLNTGHIHENHKWIVLSSAALNIIAAAGFLKFQARLKEKVSPGFIRIPVLFASLFLLTYAGFVENIPFFTTKVYGRYGELKSEMIDHINLSFSKDAVFLTKNWTDVHLSGRAVYYASRSHPAVALDVEKRASIQSSILQSKSREALCELLLREDIQGILYNLSDKGFSDVNLIVSEVKDSYRDFVIDGKEIRVVNTKIACN